MSALLFIYEQMCISLITVSEQIVRCTVTIVIRVMIVLVACDCTINHIVFLICNIQRKSMKKRLQISSHICKQQVSDESSFIQP
jgi:hypothetical protein